MPKIIHFRNDCIGCNSCAEIDPIHWKINEKDGKIDLLNSIKKGNNYVLSITNVDLEKAQQAARDCPMRIIKVEI